MNEVVDDLVVCVYSFSVLSICFTRPMAPRPAGQCGSFFSGTQIPSLQSGYPPPVGAEPVRTTTETGENRHEAVDLLPVAGAGGRRGVSRVKAYA